MHISKFPLPILMCVYILQVYYKICIIFFLSEKNSGQELGPPPSARELAERLGVTPFTSWPSICLLSWKVGILATRGALQSYNLMREIVPSIKSDRHVVNPNAESALSNSATVSLSLLIETCQAQESYQWSSDKRENSSSHLALTFSPGPPAAFPVPSPLLEDTVS